MRMPKLYVHIYYMCFFSPHSYNGITLAALVGSLYIEYAAIKVCFGAITGIYSEIHVWFTLAKCWSLFLAAYCCLTFASWWYTDFDLEHRTCENEPVIPLKGCCCRWPKSQRFLSLSSFLFSYLFYLHTGYITKQMLISQFWRNGVHLAFHSSLFTGQRENSSYANFSDILIPFLKVVALLAWKKALDDMCHRDKICTFFIRLFRICDSKTMRRWAKQCSTSQHLTRPCTSLYPGWLLGLWTTYGAP